MASDSEDDYEKFDIPKLPNEQELARLYEDQQKVKGQGQKSSCVSDKNRLGPKVSVVNTNIIMKG